MATKDLGISDIKKQEELEDITTCCICTEVFTDPKGLPCMHTFCMKCLKKLGLTTNRGPGDGMPCPICRQQFMIPPEGFHGLPKNFFIERLIGLRVANVSDPSAVAKALCSLCLEESNEQEGKETPIADLYCVDCKYKLCENCCTEHRKFKATKNHKLMPIIEHESTKNTKTNLPPGVCELHRRNFLDVYCTDCETVVCAICFIEKHINHKGSHVDKLVVRFRKQIESNAEAINDCKAKAQNKQAELLEVKEETQRTVKQLECEVDNRTDALKQLIDEQKAALLQDLCTKKESKLKETQMATDDIDTFLSCLETYNSYSQEILAKGSASDICGAFSNLSVRVVELQQQCHTMIEKEIQSFNTCFRESYLEEFLEYENCDNFIGDIEEFLPPAFSDRTEFGVDETEDQYRRNLKWAMEACVDKCAFLAERAIGSEILLAKQIVARFHKLRSGSFYVCNGCGKTVLTDYYRCLDCIDFDICQTCCGNGIIPDPESHSGEHSLVFFRYLCKGCMGFIIATRWHCNECTDFDLCNGCHNSNTFPEGSSHTADHNVSKIPTPRVHQIQTTCPEESTIRMNDEPDIAEHQHTFRPIFVQTIRANSDRKKMLFFKAAEVSKDIHGLTILDNKLFVVRENSSDVEIYDSDKLSFSRRWKLKELIDPADIVSCNIYQCLFILHSKDNWQSNEILRVSPSGKLIKKWSTGDECGYSLSVTSESTIIFTVQWENKLKEYSVTGSLVREIYLSSEAGIRHPWHAIKLTNGHFVVSHGFPGDELHRVCVVDGDGKLRKSSNGKPESGIGQMNLPVYLAVDRNGFVMVADRENCRVLLLDSDLKFKTAIRSEEDQKLNGPFKIIQDESYDRRVFVADSDKILVYRIYSN